jgi:hypothetical protein
MNVSAILPSVDVSQLQFWLAVGAGLLVSLLALSVGWRTLRQPTTERMPEVDSVLDEKPQDDRNVRREKRRAHRRKGRTTEILIADKDFRNPKWRGYVIDRSALGLRLFSERPADVDDQLNVQVMRPANDMPWIEVAVIHCKPLHDGFELGCKFIHSPSWNLLLTFG